MSKREEPNLKIGELVENLNKEFTNISVSKIRYFEDKGLIYPHRDESGYRKYSQADFEQLCNILRAQKEEHLPLEVIAHKIKSGLLQKKQPRRSKLFISEKEATTSLTERELLNLAQITNAQLKVLKDSKLIEADADYSEDDLDIANAAKELLFNGFEARHLKIYKRAVEQETNLVMQSTIPLFLKKEKKEAFEKLDELANAGKALKQALLKKEIRTALK